MTTQRRRVNRRAIAFMAATLVASIAAIAPSQAQEEPGITVSPSVDIVSSQTVRIQGSVDRLGGSLIVGQCLATADFSNLLAAGSGCQRLPSPGGTGPAIDHEVKVSAEFTTGLDNIPVDCRASQCVIVATNFRFSSVAIAPLSFLPGLSISPTPVVIGETVDLEVQGLSVEAASALQCTDLGSCGVIGAAVVDGDSVMASVVASRDFVLDDGTPAQCELATCRIGFRLSGPDFDGGQIDLAEEFSFAGDFGVTVTPSVIHEGDSVLVEATVPSPRGSVQYAQCLTGTDFTSLIIAAEGCPPPRTLTVPGEVAFTFTPTMSVSPVFGPGPTSCIPAGNCVVAVEASAGTFDVYTAPIQVLPKATLAAVPSAGLDSGDVVQLTTNTLASVDGAVAFAMQCGFLAFYELRCGPTGTVVNDFATGAYEGEIAVQRSFFDDGVAVECDVNAACAVFVLVLDPILNATSGAVQSIAFAPPID